MKQPGLTDRFYKCISAFFLLVVLCPDTLKAQQLKMSDFALFGGSGDIQNPYFTGVEIGPNSNIQGGSVGSYTRIESRGSLVQNANMYSGGSIQLSSHNTITGNISAANSNKITGTILSAGFDAKINGNVDANGNIVINGNG